MNPAVGRTVWNGRKIRETGELGATAWPLGLDVSGLAPRCMEPSRAGTPQRTAAASWGAKRFQRFHSGPSGPVTRRRLIEEPECGAGQRTCRLSEADTGRALRAVGGSHGT